MTMKTALLRWQSALSARAARTWQAARAHPWRTLALVPAALLLYVLVLIPFTPSIGDIKKAKREHPTVVMSADGKEIATYKRINRDWVKLSEMSPALVDALIATEDKRFFDHHGMDFARTAKALVATLQGDRQGGSTLTQQLARNLYPEQVGRAPTITRKLKEAITALKIEAVYTKQEILETYLNTVPFLYNAYGVEMAARTYFDKPASKLEVVEAATLVGMLKGTSYYNPVLNPERSLERRNTVLGQMVKAGKLDEARYAALSRRPLGLDFEKLPEVDGPAPHLARQLRQWLGEWAERNGYNIFSDGLVVRTTIDSRLQDYANRAVKEQTQKLQGLADARRAALRGNKAIVDAFVRDTPQYAQLRQQGVEAADALKQLQGDKAFMEALWDAKTQLQAGFLAVEPGTGYVRAWVGSRDFGEDQFDHVNQARRQPGSTFKPFVYAAAFEQGISPLQTFADAPVEIRIDHRTVWRPKDVDPPTGAMMTLRDALAQSKNTITAQLMQQVGPDRVARLAQSMGVRQSKLDPVPALALGTSPVTLKEMVASYATIANGGSYVEPQLVLRIEDREGNVLEEFHPAAPQSALPTEAAHTLLDTMRAAIDSGTAIRIRAGYGIQADVAGKTGTTQNDTDGWFILMHPQVVAGAWVGFNDARVTMLHEWGQGSRSALPIVGDFVQKGIQAKIFDGRAQFAAPRHRAEDPSLMGRVNDWLGGIFGYANAPAAPDRLPEVVVTQPSVPLPELPAGPSYEPAARVPDASIPMGTGPGTGGYGAASGVTSAGGTSGASSPSSASAGASTPSSILSLGLPPARSSTPPGSGSSSSSSSAAAPTTPSRVIVMPPGGGSLEIAGERSAGSERSSTVGSSSGAGSSDRGSDRSSVGTGTAGSMPSSPGTASSGSSSTSSGSSSASSSSTTVSSSPPPSRTITLGGSAAPAAATGSAGTGSGSSASSASSGAGSSSDSGGGSSSSSATTTESAAPAAATGSPNVTE